jgi:energy-coupling factor transporter ATP-binding protein EcfA2
MRTLLSQFCEEFDAAVRPLLDPLRRTTDTLGETPDSAFSKAVLPTLLDVADQFHVLADKVAEQQAYVLIFGPLKSGKSTLMNAMSAAYVSEVTSLPAYPCMVYVSDSDQRKFTVTRYNGDTEVFQDPAALRMQVARAHTDLADRIRKVEADGDDFDPLRHFDEAIRRVDVKVPAGELAQSGSVLVDTPGLYSRMKFGYDRMTKDFQNAAACAIFVVKTDNLFLEQVFSEFTKLLDLFSRIFLVVNLDSTKRDLMPDGSLVPSLESEDPIRVVEAFENLSMSAPLKAAADEGRLRIYPVDLMNAAAKRLSKGKLTRAGVPAEPLEDSDEANAAEGVATSGQADFDAFMSDLSEYLNSTDYLVAFLGDSLRRAMTLLTETSNAGEHETVQTIQASMEELEEERRVCDEKLHAVERLDTYDWNNALHSLQQDLQALGQQESRAVRENSTHVIAEKLDRWFQSDASLKSLIHGDLQPLIESSQRHLALTVHERLTEDVASGASGVSLPHEVARDLFTIGLQFAEFGRGGLDHLDPVAGIAGGDMPFGAADIPVKRSLFDWILLRSQAKRKQRLFGAPSNPTLRVPAELKAKRLGDEARKVMQASLASYQETRFPEILQALTQRIFNDYAQAVTKSLASRLGERRTELKGQLIELDSQLKQLRKVTNHFEQLGAATEASRSVIRELSQRYQSANPDHLMRPIDKPDAADMMRSPINIAQVFESMGLDEPPNGAAKQEIEIELKGEEI